LAKIEILKNFLIKVLSESRCLPRSQKIWLAKKWGKPKGSGWLLQTGRGVLQMHIMRILYR